MKNNACIRNEHFTIGGTGNISKQRKLKSLSSYLFELEQLNYEQIPEQKVGQGWVGGDGFSPHVDELVFDGEQSFKHIFNSIGEKGDFNKWLDIMRDIRKTSIAGRLFLAGICKRYIGTMWTTSVFLHIWGGTEVGKTVGLMIAASVWASPKMGDYISTFNSTSVAQELLATKALNVLD